MKHNNSQAMNSFIYSSYFSGDFVKITLNFLYILLEPQKVK